MEQQKEESSKEGMAQTDGSESGTGLSVQFAQCH